MLLLTFENILSYVAATATLVFGIAKTMSRAIINTGHHLLKRESQCKNDILLYTYPFIYIDLILID